MFFVVCCCLFVCFCFNLLLFVFFMRIKLIITSIISKQTSDQKYLLRTQNIPLIEDV